MKHLTAIVFIASAIAMTGCGVDRTPIKPFKDPTLKSSASTGKSNSSEGEAIACPTGYNIQPEDEAKDMTGAGTFTVCHVPNKAQMIQVSGESTAESLCYYPAYKSSEGQVYAYLNSDGSPYRFCTEWDITKEAIYVQFSLPATTVSGMTMNQLIIVPKKSDRSFQECLADYSIECPGHSKGPLY